MAGKPMMPELKKFMEKRISVRLNGARLVSGRLRGYDHFMNLVLDESVEEAAPGAAPSAAGEQRDIGLIVSLLLAAPRLFAVAAGGRGGGVGAARAARGARERRRLSHVVAASHLFLPFSLFPILLAHSSSAAIA